MNAPTLLVVGNDRISGHALAAIEGRFAGPVVVDASTDLGRLVRLLRRGSLSPRLLATMALCELRRPRARASRRHARFTTNRELVALIERHAPRRIVLFRAGLIVNQAVLSTGVPVHNIHCARLPDFGGIGAIRRALDARAYEQCATLHEVVETIDSGRVLATEPYRLDPGAGYCANESRAYEAGVRLLLRVLE